MTPDTVNILLIDDRPENLIALESVLDNLGQNIVLARSGAEALRHLLHEDFAVILLDVQMPDLDGFETASLIRSRPRSQHTPIIFLTAISKTEQNVIHGYSLGAVDYVTKPFDPVILRAKVSAFVDLAIKTQQLEAEVARRLAAEDEVRRLNEGLERRVNERTAQLAVANKSLATEVEVRKRAEERATQDQKRIQSLNLRLQRAMTETHHRVKNNLQIIAAMLDMRVMHGETTVPARYIRQLGSQVQTLAAVHDVLTLESKLEGEVQNISSKAVLGKLLGLLKETSTTRIITYSVADTKLPIQQGTALALIVNELVTNALKHGKGEVEVSLGLNGKFATLSVSDHGPGFPEAFSFESDANTGLELVRHLSRWDLGAAIDFGNGREGGARIVLKIPLKKKV